MRKKETFGQRECFGSETQSKQEKKTKEPPSSGRCIHKKEITMNRHIRSLAMFVLLCLLASCSSPESKKEAAKKACPLTQAAWLKPPDDAAVMNEPAFGNYFVNADQSIWAGAWWAESDKYSRLAGENGNKLGWFRPAGADLSITGQRLDAKAPALEAEIPCCYPTRFQATGLYFPTGGCWEVIARAEDKELKFVVWVEEGE